MPFAFPCFRTLRLRLGELDAVVECMELAVREFDTGARAAPSIQLHIEQLSEKHGVRVNATDLDVFRRHAVHLYLVSVHQSFEGFLTDMKDEHPASTTWVHPEKEDLLSRVARNVKFDIRSGHASAEYVLSQYYRSIRNRFVHPALRGRGSDDETEVAALRETAKSAGYDRLDAPNSYSLVTFDDFVLFTRCAKRLADDLCTAGRPDDRVLADIAWKNAEQTRVSRKLRNNPGRLRLAVAGFLQTEYSLDATEAERITDLGPLA